MDESFEDKPKMDFANIGLTKEQVEERVAKGQINSDNTLKTKSVGRIVRENVFTLFNLINIVLAIAVFYVGSYKNLLFMIVVLCNLAIGIFQGLRAKRTIDKLSIISMVKAKVIRGGEKTQIALNEIVIDDIIELKQGDQVPTDCTLLVGSCDVNESLLTGESDAIYKEIGDTLMSGSFIVSGTCRVQAKHVGKDNYASEIFSGAKYIKKINSEIMRTLNRIIQIISVAIIPLGILLFFRQMNVENGQPFELAVVNTVAALIGMIPEGLILLTSTVLAVSVIRLSKHKVLVQELYCIETLARVDVLCLDKTGTITEGCMEVHDAIPYGDCTKDKLEEILTACASASQDENPTICAIKERYTGKSSYKPIENMAFSSEKKWSGTTFAEKGTYILGAEEFVLGKNANLKEEMHIQVEDGFRVLVVAHAQTGFSERELPSDLYPVGLVVIKDKIRKEAKKTLRYFAKQGVELKIISGDSVQTVAAIAKEAGLKEWDKHIDASTLETDEEVIEAATAYSIFGRVTPTQKCQLIKALKEAGHTVAMTGDGVNDVLALKEADCSVAMASGSQAARSVSQLVLLDSNFSSMPKVVAEGRRSINNIQRSSSLFLVKTIYSFLLTVIFVCIGAQYPFQPIQMTLISTFTIGIPSFILALEPNNERVKGNFFSNILSKAVPGGVAVALNMVLIVILDAMIRITPEQSSTLSVITTSFIGLMVLFKISNPFDGMFSITKNADTKKKKVQVQLPKNPIRTILFVAMVAGSLLCIIGFRDLFSLVPLDFSMIVLLFITLGIAVLTYIALNALYERTFKRFIRKAKL